jgi:equilibrative nucleoside transporter 1/2/3
MSGQGGIAVLVSGAQVFLAMFSALGSRGGLGETAGQSKMAGVGLWAIGALGSGVCLGAQRYLETHVDYERIIEPLYIRRDADERKGGMEVIKTVFKKNLLLEIAVAWVFVVTLVGEGLDTARDTADGQSVFPPITSRILSVHAVPGRLRQASVFIPFHFFVFNGKCHSHVSSLSCRGGGENAH